MAFPEGDILLALCVDGKIEDSRDAVLDFVLHCSPVCVMSINCSGIDEFGDLILIFNGDSANINSLMNVLVEVLDGMEGADKFNIDVALELEKDPGVVRHDPSAVKDKAIFLNSVTVDGSFVLWVAMTIVREASFVTVGFRKILGTDTIDHAGAIKVGCSTGSMQHFFIHQLMQLRLCLWVGYVCPNDVIDVIHS